MLSPQSESNLVICAAKTLAILLTNFIFYAILLRLVLHVICKCEIWKEKTKQKDKHAQSWDTCFFLGWGTVRKY